MPPIPNPFTLRVYFEDTDAGGVVYYANYLKFFERARTEWLRSLGIEQGALQVQDGVLFVVAEVNVRYVASARLDDLLTVSVQVVEQGKASLQMAQQAWRGDTLLAEARVRVGCVDGANMRPRRIPAQVVKALGAALGAKALTPPL
jgi:acyl-CoA thioester hydrolase